MSPALFQDCCGEESSQEAADQTWRVDETLRQAQREIKIEGEGTLILRVRGDRPVIVSFEQAVPGDST